MQKLKRDWGLPGSNYCFTHSQQGVELVERWTFFSGAISHPSAEGTGNLQSPDIGPGDINVLKHWLQESLSINSVTVRQNYEYNVITQQFHITCPFSRHSHWFSWFHLPHLDSRQSHRCSSKCRHSGCNLPTNTRWLKCPAGKWSVAITGVGRRA